MSLIELSWTAKKNIAVHPSICVNGSVTEKDSKITKMIKYDTQRWSMNLDNSGYVKCKYKYVNLHKGIKDLNSRYSFMM